MQAAFDLGGSPWARFGATGLAAVGVALLLFLWMQWMIRAPEAPPDAGRRLSGVELVKVQETPEQTPEELFRPESQPPPPPAAPPALSAPANPSIPVPALALAPAEVGTISVPLASGAARGTGLSSSGSFAGFAGQGGGAGTGGSGQGFRGRPLIPLSTARPQMPEWACEKQIRGWVEVVFTVMPNGRVQNVKLVDADPRGVFEAAAIESIGNWIYEQSSSAREVKQRVPMNPEDCAFNYPR